MNGNVVNMLAAKKVKLHGMMSSKWTTSDKIVQYRGLINLYTRDRKIIELDTNVNRRKLQRELKDLQKSVFLDRRQLDNAIRGDKQKLRNTLAEHKRLQLAYQNSQPKRVIEHIDQLNFNRRKVLDRLKYEKKLKSQRLIDLKLEQALLEDRLKYASLGQIKQEKEAQIITGKLQDAILRKEAAWAIHHIYREILDIMKKDGLYFEVILTTVNSDGFAQSKCFLGATKLGQMATEYLDDRRQEYDSLEKIIIKDLATRKTDIRVLQEQVENAAASIKQLLRKDSDITTCAVQLADSPSLEELRKDVGEVEGTLQYLKEATLVPTYEAIYPCLQEQKKQKRRLRYLAKKCERDRDILQNKTNHAQLMSDVLKNTMLETTTEYQATKAELQKAVEELKHTKQSSEAVIRIKRTTAAKLRIGLKQLSEWSLLIKGNEPRNEEKKESLKSNPDAVTSPLPKQSSEFEEIDGCKYIPILVNKFTTLLSHQKLKEGKIDDAFKQFEALMQERMILADHVERKLSETSFLQGLYQEPAPQVTREDIKKQSETIVAENTKNDDLVPMFALPKKRKKFGPPKGRK